MERRHREPQGQPIAPAEGEEIEDVWVEVEEQEAEDGRHRRDESIQETKAEIEIKRIAQEARQPEDELSAPEDRAEELGQQGVQEMIVGDAEIENRGRRRGQVSDVGLSFIDGKWNADRPEDRIGEEAAREDRNERQIGSSPGRFHRIRHRRGFFRFAGKSICENARSQGTGWKGGLPANPGGCKRRHPPV